MRSYFWLKNHERRETQCFMYATHQAAFSTYAVVTPDGVWHGKGKMGWWAMSSETPEEARDWEDQFKERFITSSDPELLLTIVDCHI